MKPTKGDDELVDVLDVLLREGVVVRADVIISVAEIPLIGVKLTAALAGMETMTDYGLFEEWDTERRAAATARRQYGHRERPLKSAGSVAGETRSKEEGSARPSDADRRERPGG